jgi:Ca2+-binding EF-hand superfamily protein
LTTLSRVLAWDVAQAAFHALDLDDDGDIDIDDLKKLLPSGFDEEALQRMLDGADVVKDGMLDLAEFKALMRSGAI